MDKSNGSGKGSYKKKFEALNNSNLSKTNKSKNHDSPTPRLKTPEPINVESVKTTQKSMKHPYQIAQTNRFSIGQQNRTKISRQSKDTINKTSSSRDKELTKNY